MRAVVVYESMFGGTRMVAEAIAEGMSGECVVWNVIEADTALDRFDLVVVGGPTHAWGMSWPSTRRAAPLRVQKAAGSLELVPGADKGPGVREWLASLGRVNTNAAAFDTRFKSPALFTGRASTRIKRQLLRHGLSLVVPPESFLVDKDSHLIPGELERARVWGAQLAAIERPQATRARN